MSARVPYSDPPLFARRFLCKWGAGYIPDERTTSMAAFGPRNGYAPEDCSAINALRVGETWTAPTSEVHTVTRLPDAGET